MRDYMDKVRKELSLEAHGEEHVRQPPDFHILVALGSSSKVKFPYLTVFQP